MPSITIPQDTLPVKEEHAYSPTQPVPASASAAPASAPATHARSQSSSHDYFDHKPPRSRSSSPERPPVSPITPIATHAELPSPLETSKYVPPTIPPPEFIPAPKPEPIKEWNENVDVLALRSAISLLQMQREKAKKDLVTLENVKQAAIADPDAYLQEVRARRAQQKPKKSLAEILGPAETDLLAPTLSSDDEDEEGPSGENGSESAGLTGTRAPRFQPAPQPQNVVRCPPVNWAKYHVLGDTLDKMHAEQLTRPNFDGRSSKAPPHHIAAPYSPFTDQVRRPSEQSQTQSKKGSKKPNP